MKQNWTITKMGYSKWTVVRDISPEGLPCEQRAQLYCDEVNSAMARRKKLADAI